MKIKNLCYLKLKMFKYFKCIANFNNFRSIIKFNNYTVNQEFCKTRYPGSILTTLLISFISITFLFFVNTAHAERIKDISSISGIRNNQLIGYGLVVGLDGTGDNSEFTGQSFKTMLTRLGIHLPSSIKASSRNIAAVAIHAQLPAFARPGTTIDITVSSIGSAKSLRGGTLLLSQLKGVDGKVYAIAQGNLVVSGVSALGSDNSQIKLNIPVVGRIPNGATIEVASPSTFSYEENVTFLLNRPDFTTAKRMAETINQFMGKGTADPIDAASVNVNVPCLPGDKVRFISALENLTLNPGECYAKVVVNSRTGTIIIGKNVIAGPAAISHGGLTVTISEEQNVSQPLPGSLGKTTITNQSEIDIIKEKSKLHLFKKGVSLEEVVAGINKIGVSPTDLIAILEALKQAGSLSADLEII